MAKQIDAVLTATSEPDQRAEEIRLKEEKMGKAKSQWKLSSEAEVTVRRDSLDDVKFSVGDQWPEDIRTERTTDQRPCLTMNKLPKYIRQVTNEQRSNKSAVQISPVGDGASKDIADILEGMVRHIQADSSADIAYDTGFDQMVRGGFGYWRLVTDYENDRSFNQVIKIKRVKNQFTVYFDPTCQEPDYSDAEFAFVIEDMGRSKYKLNYKNSEAATLSDFSSIGDQMPGWGDKDTIRVAEWWYVEYEKKSISLLNDGRVIDTLDVQEGEIIIQSRETVERKVKCAIINGQEVIEEKNWMGRWIPIIPCLGDDIDVNGSRHLSGLVRHAKDPMRMYNYWVTSATETIALAPKAPYIVATGQLEGRETIWSNANRKNYPYLEYNPKTVDSQLAPPPQRQNFEPPIQAMLGMTKQAEFDLNSTTGIFEASLGQRGPEESGKALLSRQKQSSLSTLNFSDNFSRSLKFTGIQILDLIPKIYDAPRIQRIINADNSVSHVVVHNSLVSGQDEATIRNNTQFQAIERIIDLGTGTYAVAVTIGQSYETKRQEAAESILELVQNYPQIMQIAGDVLLRNMDWPGAEEVANRMKASLPPEMQNLDSADPKSLVMSLSSQLSQTKAALQQCQMVLKEANDTINSRRIESESRERIANMQGMVDLIKAEAKMRGDGALAVLKAELGALQSRIDHLQNKEALEIQAENQPSGEQQV